METNKREFENLGKTVRLWIKNWKWFALSAFICLCFGVLFILRSHTVYKVEASIVISEGDKSGMSAMMGDLSDVFGSGGIVDDEVYKISAHSVFVQTAKDLGLSTTYYRKGKLRLDRKFDNSPLVLTPALSNLADTLSTGLYFDVSVSKNGNEVSVKGKAKRSTICNIKNAKFPVNIKTPYGNFTLNKTDFYVPGKKLKMKINFSSYDSAAEDIKESVKIFIATKKANVIMMSTKTSCVPYSIALLNKIIQVYNEKGILERNREGSQTLEFINSRLAFIEKDLVSSENLVESFKNEKNMTDVTVEAGVQTNKRIELEKVVNQLRIELELIDMTEDFLRNPANKNELIPNSNVSVGVNEAIKNYNAIILNRMRVAQNAKEGNISLEMIDKQLAPIRENILASISKIRKDQATVYDAMQAQLNKAYSKLSNVPSQERELRELLRQQGVWEKLYTMLLKNREETSMMIANATPRGIIIDEAYALQRPVSIGKGMTLMIALILGLIIPAVFFLVRPIFRNKFSTRSELQSRTDLPILGELSVVKDVEPIVIKKGSYSVINELFTNIRTNLQFLIGKKDHNVVVITSTTPGEGKSFVSINFAASLSLLDKKVVLVGMDIRKPRLAQYLQVSANHGVTDYLVGNCTSVSEIVTKNPSLPFDLIAAGPVPPNPAELLNSDRLGSLISSLKQEYDYVIIDTAPIGAVSDTFAILKYADVTMYVTRANHTTFDDISYLNDTVKEKDIKNIALVINGTKTSQGYGYGYGEHVKKKGFFSFLK